MVSLIINSEVITVINASILNRCVHFVGCITRNGVVVPRILRGMNSTYCFNYVLRAHIG